MDSQQLATGERKSFALMSGQAVWRWHGVDYNEVGKLEVVLPERNTHPVLHIKARIEDCDGDFGEWQVWENGELVALGTISSSDPLWRNGNGPKLEAERVITQGANDADKARAKAYNESRKARPK